MFNFKKNIKKIGDWRNDDDHIWIMALMIPIQIIVGTFGVYSAEKGKTKLAIGSLIFEALCYVYVSLPDSFDDEIKALLND